MLLLLLPPPLKGGLSPLVSPLLLMARICRQINHDQSRTWPWSRAQPDEKLLRLTHCALEPWHELIDPMMGESRRSLLVDCHSEWLQCSFSDQRGRCQNYKAAFKWLPGSVHSVKVCALRVQASVQKHDHRDLGNVMMSLADLDVSRLQSGTPKEVVLMDYPVIMRLNC